MEIQVCQGEAAPVYRPALAVDALVNMLAIKLALNGVQSAKIDEIKRDVHKIAEVAASQARAECANAAYMLEVPA